MDPSSGTHNLDSDDASVAEELEMIAVSRTPFRQLALNPNMGTNLKPEKNGGILSKIVCVKLHDDIHNPWEMTGQL